MKENLSTDTKPYKSRPTKKKTEYIGRVTRIKNNIEGNYSYILTFQSDPCHAISGDSLHLGTLVEPEDEGKILIITVEEKEEKQ